MYIYINIYIYKNYYAIRSFVFIVYYTISTGSKKKPEENEERSKTRYAYYTYNMYAFIHYRLVRILLKKKKTSRTVRFAYDINVFFNCEIIESPHP